MSVFGRFLCSLHMHKWWSTTRRDFDPARSPRIDFGVGRVSGYQVEYRCARCGKRRNPEWEDTPG